MFCGTDIQFRDNHLAVLRKTHPKAYRTCMDTFGHKTQLMALFKIKKDNNILSALTDTGKTARIVNAVGDSNALLRVRPCAFDDYGDMVDLTGTGLDAEYDPEQSE